jgi:aryl-alcohol dehydrogenase-like predicted oxidoreductase
MEYTILGRTGIRVSVAGLGCGGFSRLGLGTGRSEAEAIALVHEALDLGVNLFDTAAAYGTEGVLGRALKKVPRDRIVIATKVWTPRGAGAAAAARAVASLDRSLGELGTDYIDIFQLHGVSPGAYQQACTVIAPALARERERGKLRHLGVTETGSSDPTHEMLASAVLPRAIANRVGTLAMFAVRNVFSQGQRLRAELQRLAARGEVAGWLGQAPNPLGFLIHEADGGATSVVDAAYRFVRHEPGVDVVLSGTGDPAHLRANIASILKPPLPETDRRILKKHFGHLVGIGLDPPTTMPGFTHH